MKPRLRDVSVIGRGGFRRLAYVEWGSPKAERTVVCVHGVTRNGRDFDALAGDLAEHGMRVVAPDLPGRGRSDWLESPLHYTDRCYTHAMSTLIARLDVEHVDWVGTSLGGHIGMLMAAEQRSPLRRLVLNDFGARVAAGALRRIGGYLRQDWRFDTPQAAEAHLREALAPFGALSDRQWRHLAEHSTAAGDDGRLRFRHDPAIGLRFAVPIMIDVVLWSLWETVSCPVLVLRGEASDLLTRATVDEMQRRGTAARAGLVQAIEFAGCGHAPALMEDGQIAVVRKFLLEGNSP
ncbi:alpha/beta fold hydrolase [Ideonella sp. YS5]|uniref:alpha/beta fold hydrolase n=1 Tax=Ideonella sp. YS5 TaxID=3453714 RepID=UPI003EEF73E0